MPLLKKQRRDACLRIDFTSQLFSDELVLGTFAYLSAHDLIECGKVNHAWSRLSRDAELWRPLYEERFNKPLCTFKAKWNPVAEYQLPFSNWKDQYRIHQNWLTGYCTSYRHDTNAFSEHSNTWGSCTLQYLIQYTRDLLCVCNQARTQVELWHIGRSTARHLCCLDDILDNNSRHTITFMKLKEATEELDDHTGQQQQGYRLTIGTSAGGFGVWSITTAKEQETTRLVETRRTSLYRSNPRGGSAVVALDVCYPMLIMCTANMKLQAFDISNPTPRQVLLLESPIPWSPVVLHLTRHLSATQWRAILCYGMLVMGNQTSIGTQEIIFTANGLSSSRHSSILDPRPTHLTLSTTPESRAISTLTSIVYSEPFLMTAHTSNTIKEYRLVSTPDQFTIEFVRTYYGHTCQVSSLALDSEQGRLISGSRAGLRIWDLLGLDQYKIRAKDYVVTLKPEDYGAMDIPRDDIVWIQMDAFKIVALLKNGDTKRAWFKIWSFDP